VPASTPPADSVVFHLLIFAVLIDLTHGWLSSRFAPLGVAHTLDKTPFPMGLNASQNAQKLWALIF
jgi:hypothetical protein